MNLLLTILCLLSTSSSDAVEPSSQNGRISLEKQRRVPIFQGDPCFDAQQVVNIEAVKFHPRYAALNRPWLRNNVTSKVYSSHGLHHQWSLAKSLLIRGLLNGTTVGDVLLFLDRQRCSFLAIGDVVWKLIRMVRTGQIEGEVSCSIAELYPRCVENYGSEACGFFPVEGRTGYYRLEIGDPISNRLTNTPWTSQLVLHEWGSTLGLRATQWSFTVTTMAICDDSAGHVYLVDMTGRGYVDTCKKQLAVPVPKTMWKEWSDDDPSKLYRFYQLRTFGFVAVNRHLQKHINAAIEKKKLKKVAQTFYCEFVLNGLISWAGPEDSDCACHLVYPEPVERLRIARAKRIMQEEMGNHWRNFMVQVIDEMEAVYLTERQFVEMRHHLLANNRSHADETDSDSPGILYSDDPLDNDISDVHRRPILSRAHAVDGERLENIGNDLPKSSIGGDVPKQDTNSREDLDFESRFFRTDDDAVMYTIMDPFFSHLEEENEADAEVGLMTIQSESYSERVITVYSLIVPTLYALFIC
uniref:CxC5 domain-containing protein n=1 Tax=Haemonchus contortus TaxID=6289 RepID=A0A7I4Y864_HAECO